MRVRAFWLVGFAFVLASGAAALGWYWMAIRPRVRCDDAIAERRFKDAVPLCRTVFRSTGEGRFAASAAMALVGIGEDDEAWSLANEPAARDLVRARRIRGVVLSARRQDAEAERELRDALVLALERGEASEAARAAHMLGGMRWSAERYSEAYDLIELSARQAALANDGPALALAELARGDVFRYLGDAQKADGFYRKALEAVAPWASDHAYAALKVGSAYLDAEELALARSHLREAVALAEASRNPFALVAARVRLADALVKSHEADAAEHELDAIPAQAQNGVGALLSRAEIALLRGDVAAAGAALEKLAPDQVSPQDEWEVSLLRGRVAQKAGKADAAIAAWTEAISQVEVLTAKEPQHQAWVAARRRRPFDALFALYASRGQPERAWEVVARYARAEALSLSDPSDGDPRKLLAEAEALKRHWTQTAAAQDTPAPLAAHDDREILVVHESEERLWVGTRRAGVAQLVDAGPIDRFDPSLRRLMGDAGDEGAARMLGEALWSAAGLRASDEPLYIVGTGRMRRLPFAALRRDGRYWIEQRPLAKLATLDPPSPQRRKFDGAAVVVGDPRGDLAEARAEVLSVSRAVGATAAVGRDATRQAILGARRASVLHVATHARIGLEGTALILADGDLMANEVLERRPTARVVVLASCASAVGRETSGADSLATAFLRAGSGAVVATLRTVPDAAAHQLVEAFYRHGGVADPVRGLAAAQLEVARAQPVLVWSAFTVLVGPELSLMSAVSEVAGR